MENMLKDTKVLLAAAAILILLIVGAAAYAFSVNDTTNPAADSEQGTMEKEADNMEETDDAIMDDKDKMEQSSIGTYTDYSAAKLSAAQSEDDRIVIFFAAAWCPSCRAQDNALQQSKSNIPGDVTILKADYDSEIGLRQKYEVTTQHTFVQVDTDGKLLKKWNALYNENNLQSILDRIS